MEPDRGLCPTVRIKGEMDILYSSTVSNGCISICSIHSYEKVKTTELKRTCRLLTLRE